mmetsp:Transcript_67192/g.196455  ORF Transcript_67192/g.196455 Transcript_67192/m.196455 type:complete len:336 (-) Transcript_67192:2107-3114(-)
MLAAPVLLPIGPGSVPVAVGDVAIKLAPSLLVLAAPVHLDLRPAKSPARKTRLAVVWIPAGDGPVAAAPVLLVARPGFLVPILAVVPVSVCSVICHYGSVSGRTTAVLRDARSASEEEVPPALCRLAGQCEREGEAGDVSEQQRHARLLLLLAAVEGIACDLQAVPSIARREDGTIGKLLVMHVAVGRNVEGVERVDRDSLLVRGAVLVQAEDRKEHRCHFHRRAGPGTHERSPKVHCCAQLHVNGSVWAPGTFAVVQAVEWFVITIDSDDKVDCPIFSRADVPVADDRGFDPVRTLATKIVVDHPVQPQLAGHSFAATGVLVQCWGGSARRVRA